MSLASSAWQRVSLKQTPASLWLNGGGQTHELVAQPPGSWLWRASVAQVACDGPFSHFAKTQRHFAVIRGAGVHLHIEGATHTVKPGEAALSFSGEQDCQCELIGGPTLDFNLMARAGTARLERWPQVQFLPWTTGQVAGIYACDATSLRHPSGQQWTLAPDELLWTSHLPAAAWHIESRDALVFAIVGSEP
jgi:environmental stress-induced protein Ves